MGSLYCRGFWIFRGQDIPPIMKEECFDLDLYTWTKIDSSDEACPKLYLHSLCIRVLKVPGLVVHR